MANSVNPDPIGPVHSGSTLFASILNSSVMLGNYLQQTTSADDIFRYIFFLTLKAATYNLQQANFKCCCLFKSNKYDMIFHENRLLADDSHSHEISYLIFRKLGKMLQNLSSAAVVNCALWVKY